MARLARVVIPGVPHHLTQRGNRRQKVFFSAEDYEAYLELLRQWCAERSVEVWAYCLMPNHVHLIVLPESEDGLRRAIGEAHRRYTRRVNFREDWRGHLWQGRFASFPMDEKHLMAAARYIERNPVRARLVRSAWDYRWSSAKAHVERRDDALVKTKPLLKRVEDWKEFLRMRDDGAILKSLREHERTGRPLGDERFIAKLERLAGRLLRRQKPGPKGRGHK
jgi:putative transposase